MLADDPTPEMVIKELEAKIAALIGFNDHHARRAAAAEQDAARYRWLRKEDNNTGYSNIDSLMDNSDEPQLPTGENLDRAIDAAIAKDRICG